MLPASIEGQIVRRSGIGGGITALVDLIEHTERAVRAESDIRAATWQDRDTIEKAVPRAAKTLASDRDALAQPSISAVSASAIWRSRLAEMLDARRDELTGLRAEEHRAVLYARAACLQAGGSGVVAAAVRGYRPLSSGRLAVRHSRALRSGVTDEFANILTRPPRSILLKLATCGTCY